MRPRIALQIAIFITLMFEATRGTLAHESHRTILFLDIGESRVNVELQVPLLPLRLALGRTTAPATAEDSLAAAELGSYLQGHLRAVARDSQPFVFKVLSGSVMPKDGEQMFIAHAVLLPPPRTSARWFHLHYDAVLQRVANHSVTVFVRHDLRNAVLGERPVLVGFLHHTSQDLVVDCTTGSLLGGMAAMFLVGVRHLVEGTFHLMFLFMLLLPASLVARAGRWTDAGNETSAGRPLMKIVIAFAIGQSLALFFGAGVALPPRLLEILIAMSILISALHALRPLYSEHEAWIVAGFGLLHGLAFSSALMEFGFDRTTLWQSAVGFNLGILAMLLAVMAVTLPGLVLLSRSSSYRFVRIGGATIGGAVAGGWIMQRGLGLDATMLLRAEITVAQVLVLVFALVMIVAGVAKLGLHQTKQLRARYIRAAAASAAAARAGTSSWSI